MRSRGLRIEGEPSRSNGDILRNPRTVDWRRGGEGAKSWLQILTELKNRSLEGILMLVCDGLKGLPDVVGGVWHSAGAGTGQGGQPPRLRLQAKNPRLTPWISRC